VLAVKEGHEARCPRLAILRRKYRGDSRSASAEPSSLLDHVLSGIRCRIIFPSSVRMIRHRFLQFNWPRFLRIFYHDSFPIGSLIRSGLVLNYDVDAISRNRTSEWRICKFDSSADPFFHAPTD